MGASKVDSNFHFTEINEYQEWVPGTPGDFVVKSKLFPCIDYIGGVIKFILNNGKIPIQSL